MNKPLNWITNVSSALLAGLDSVVSEELRATTHNICSLNRGRKNRGRLSPASNATGSAANRAGHPSRNDRKVA